jgi:hypothetical protein
MVLWRLGCRSGGISPRAIDDSTKGSYRDPDGVLGGTWEALERILKRAGYFKTGLRKMECARAWLSRWSQTETHRKAFEHSLVLFRPR